VWAQPDSPLGGATGATDRRLAVEARFYKPGGSRVVGMTPRARHAYAGARREAMTLMNRRYR